jgi:hypothetical protein
MLTIGCDYHQSFPMCSASEIVIVKYCASIRVIRGVRRGGQKP